MPKIWLTGLVDRATRTGVGTLSAYLMAAQALSEVDWAGALSATALAVLMSVLTNLMSSPSFGELWIYQLAERAIKSFVQNVIAFVGTATMFEAVDWKTGLSAALLAALNSVAMGVLTTRTGGPGAVGEVDVVSPPPDVVAAHGLKAAA